MAKFLKAFDSVKMMINLHFFPYKSYLKAQNSRPKAQGIQSVLPIKEKMPLRQMRRNYAKAS
ncbi:MAG: hypothetical protein MSG80_08505 [Campylobacter sp.]|nr:hypothetical protein [Campylobacter sp.]